jgi:signal transduction histidine kinase
VRFGGVHSASKVAVGDIDEDGEADLVAGLLRGTAGSGDENRPTVFRLDPNIGAVLDSTDLATGARELLVEDLDGRGQAEILVLGQDQGLYCLRRDLSVRWSHRHLACATIVGCADLDGQGGKEIVCVCPPSVVVLDRNGHRLAEEHVGPEARATLASVNGRTLVVAWAPTLTRVLALVPPVVPREAVVGTAAVIALAPLVTIALRQRRRRRYRSLDQQNAQEKLLDAMVAFGHGGGSLSELDRLRQLLLNWGRYVEQMRGSDDPFPAMVDSLERSVLPDIVAVTGRARLAGAPPENWRTLVPRAQEALAILRNLLQTPVGNAGSLPRRALDALNEVESGLAGIRLFLRSAFSTPLVETVAECIEARRRRHRTVRYRDPELLVAPSALVFVSAVVLRKVLENLFDNAARAVDGRESRDVGVSIDREGSYYHINVCDTGCGIAQERWDAIFLGGGRPGHGFGLPYSRRELTRFGGKIFVKSSVEGQGTTFRVSLREAELG